jgi:hypothetical protein
MNRGGGDQSPSPDLNRLKLAFSDQIIDGRSPYTDIIAGLIDRHGKPIVGNHLLTLGENQTILAYTNSHLLVLSAG